MWRRKWHTRMSYSIKRQELEQTEQIVLLDEAHASSAIIVPGIGNQAVSFISHGQEVLYKPPGMDALREKPTRYGVPVLSPPNRVRDGKFSYKGISYTLPNDGRSPHHIHGQIGKLPWKIVEQGASEEQGAYVTAQFSYEEHDDILAYFPHELIFEFTYRLKAGELSLEGHIVNTGRTEAPLAFGFHPYFALSGGAKDRVRIPAIAEWSVASDLFPQGTPQQTKGVQQVAEGLAVADFTFPDYGLFTMPAAHNRSEIISDSGRTIVYETDEHLPFMVLFRPSWAPDEAVSLEPYSCITDAFNAGLPGEVSGQRGIGPSQTVSFGWRIYTA